jgi:two-component system, OmpR family, sensor histidine kinase KdpD
VSKIVIGKPGRSLWRRIVLGSIVDALVRGSGEIDIHVVSGEGAPAPVRPLRVHPHAPNWASHGIAAAVVAVCTGLAWAMFPYFSQSNLIMVYLLGVVGVATRASRGPTVMASVLSVLAFDFFFVPPYWSFAVSDTEYLLTFFVMLFVALVTSGLTVRIRAQVLAARQRERRIAALYGMSRELASIPGVDGLLEITLRHMGEVFSGQIALLLPDESGRLVPRRVAPEGMALGVTEMGVAQWAFEHREVAGQGTATLPGARALCVPLAGPRGAVGVLVIVPPDARAFESPEALHQLETFANQTALAIERAQLADEARRAEVRVETERMRNSLLSSVSHDLRTPLSTIIGASSGLLDGGERLDTATRRDLVRSIHGEASHLDRLVNSLLEMTRLEAGAVAARKEPQALDGVLGAALPRLETLLRDRPVHVDLPADLPLVPIDAVLIEQVFLNLLDNAARYSTAGSPIDISARVVGPQVGVEVSDRGAGFAPGDEQRAFEKFYRGHSARVRGVGLGLAICRAIVEIHGGTITAGNRPGGGATIRFTLPLEGSPRGHGLSDG